MKQVIIELKNENMLKDKKLLEYMEKAIEKELEIRIHNISLENKYEKGYNALMEYWDSIPDEAKEELNEYLDKLGI